jgi:hypothetical protein
MASLTFVDEEQHRGMCFVPHTDFEFARKQPRVGLGRHEVRPLVQSLPVFLCRREGLWSLLGCMGLVGTGNMMIGPQGGWMGPYIPDKLRFRPYTLSRRDEEGSLLLAYRGDKSPLVPGSEHQLVDDKGEVTPLYQNMVARLKLPLRTQESTQEVAEALLKTGLLEEIINSPLLIPKDCEGSCFTVDMRRLRDLSKEDIFALIEVDALSLGYEIYHSSANVQRLRQAAQLRSAAATSDLDAPGILQAEEDFSFNFD